MKVPPVMRVVLHELADFLDTEGKAYPSLDLLAERSVVSRATVMRTLEEAIAAGYLIKEARSRKHNMGQTSNAYRFVMLEAELQIATLPAAEYQNATQAEGAELQDDTLPSGPELQIDMGQSCKLQQPELQIDTPLEPSLSSSLISDPSKTKDVETVRLSPPIPSPDEQLPFLAEPRDDEAPANPTPTKRAASNPRQPRQPKPVDTRTPRERGLAVLADAAFMAELHEEFPTVDLAAEGRGWLLYIEEKPPTLYKSSFRNRCIKSIKFAEEDAKRTSERSASYAPSSPRAAPPRPGTSPPVRAAPTEEALKGLDNVGTKMY